MFVFSRGLQLTLQSVVTLPRISENSWISATSNPLCQNGIHHFSSLAGSSLRWYLLSSVLIAVLKARDTSPLLLSLLPVNWLKIQEHLFMWFCSSPGSKPLLCSSYLNAADQETTFHPTAFLALVFLTPAAVLFHEPETLYHWTPTAKSGKCHWWSLSARDFSFPPILEVPTWQSFLKLSWKLRMMLLASGFLPPWLSLQAPHSYLNSCAPSIRCYFCQECSLILTLLSLGSF